MLDYTHTQKAQILTSAMTQSTCAAPFAHGDELTAATAVAHHVTEGDPAAALAPMVDVQPAGDSSVAAPSTAANGPFAQKQSTLPSFMRALPSSFDSALNVSSTHAFLYGTPRMPHAFSSVRIGRASTLAGFSETSSKVACRRRSRR